MEKGPVVIVIPGIPLDVGARVEEERMKAREDAVRGRDTELARLAEA